MKLIKIYYEAFKEKESIDDITWNDLEMDEVFSKINYTKSYIGEQVLYKRLHEPAAGRDWDTFEEQIVYLQQHPKERAKIEKQLKRIGKRSESYYLPEFLKNTELWEIKNGYIYHILQFLLLFFVVAGIVTENDIFFAGFLAIAAINLLVYMSVKLKYEMYLYSLGSVRQIIVFSKKMVSVKAWKSVFESGEIEDAVHALSKVSRGIGRFVVRKRGSWSGDPLALFQDYLLGIILYDVSVFNHIMRMLDKKQDKLLLLYQFVGEIDMVNAMVTFREKVGQVCTPEISSETECSMPDKRNIYMKGIRHPLLENAVPNDFHSSGRALISGANASGKSTFMKAVAINVILAQTIHTCTAEEMRIPGIFVMTSMALRDDILSGESYYIREVKYLKRMLDVIETGAPVLCVIDEILKGTNTKERLAASEAILKYFREKNCFVMVATHDMELVEEMQEVYECYYFESKICEKDIQFDYILHRGIGGKSNAIALLELLGYPVSIVEGARHSLIL